MRPRVGGGLLIVVGEGNSLSPFQGSMDIGASVSGGSDASGFACGCAGQAASIAPGQALSALRASNGKLRRAPGAAICSRRYASAGYKTPTCARRVDLLPSVCFRGIQNPHARPVRQMRQGAGPKARQLLAVGVSPRFAVHQDGEPQRGDSDPSRHQDLYAPFARFSERSNRDGDDPGPARRMRRGSYTVCD